MIRSFMPFDVVDLLVAGRALSNKAKTRDGVGRKDARLSDLANIVSDWFNPQLRLCVWVYTDETAAARMPGRLIGSWWLIRTETAASSCWSTSVRPADGWR
jgi:hypothetical protein